MYKKKYPILAPVLNLFEKTMEEFKKRDNGEMSDKEILFSKSIKAGKRIYYLDVKKSRKDEMFLAITESKKIFSNGGDESQVTFEKHKIFLYREDFEKFMDGLSEAIGFINNAQGECPEKGGNGKEEKESGTPEETVSKDSEIKIDIDFEWALPPFEGMCLHVWYFVANFAPLFAASCVMVN